MKKTFVLVVLFVLPIVAYLFFASGVNNFGKLPILTEQVVDINSGYSKVSFKDKISILGFLGKNVLEKKGNVFNLNQKIYKPFYQFNDFQFVMMVPKGTEEQVKELKKELGSLGDNTKWLFVFEEESNIKKMFSSLENGYTLDENLATSNVFIIDKKMNLRGRNDDEDEGVKHGYNTTSVAELNNKMEDDVKIILAEYRLALKKNTSNRTK